MTAARPRSIALRRVWLTLAALALVIKVLVPPGFMVGAAGPAQTAALVICTGQGAVVVDARDLPGHHDPVERGDHEAPCVFAGHGLGAPPPDLAGAERVVFAAYAPARPSVLEGLAPGRGLAAPPPPATGPPTPLI